MPDSALALSASSRTRRVYSPVKMRRFGFGDHLGIRVATADRGRSGLVSRDLTTALYGQGRRVCFVFFMLNFLPALLFN